MVVLKVRADVALMIQLQRSSHDENKNIEIKKFCVDCKATDTPLWRCGPSGPKTLCNACGIKYRKKNLVSAGLEKRGREKKLVSGREKKLVSGREKKLVSGREKKLVSAGLEKRGRKKKKSRISTSTIGADSGNSDVGDTVKSLKTDGARNGMMSESLKIRLIVCGLARNGREEKNSYTRTSANGATNCSYSSADTVKTRVRNGLMSSEYLKMGLILRGNEMMFPKSPIVKKRRCQRRRKLGEEEQAAFSLMALSCGCFSMNKGRSVVQNGAKFLETSAHIP